MSPIFSSRYGTRRIILTLFFTISITGLLSCSKRSPEPEIITITDDEARRDADDFINRISVNLLDDLEISLWASKKLLGDPIAIHMDDQGRAWVTVTNRSRSSEFDIRDVDQSWLMESMKWTSVEERRNFLRRELSPERSEENTWLPDLNEDGSHDWRDLTVEKEEVYRIEDLSGNNLANRSQLFIRDFHEEVTDVAGAVVYYNEEVFLGVGPDLWRIRDTNGDGMADWKESISHGYNVHIGFSGHGMSGLTVGPDGRIYWSIGDMGFNIVDKDGNHWYHPHEGGIFRSDPDGSNFEVFATGLRNTHEFVFDKYGNLITVDNDGDHAGEFERLVHLIDGSDSGWRINWQFGKYTDPKNNSYKVWMDEDYYKPRFEDQAAHILPPLSRYHSGPAGMAYHPGTALNESWKDHFFVASFRGAPASSGIYAFTLKEDGASFQLDTDRLVTNGILPVGMDFGPDGALYMADWVETWRTTGQGRLLKLDTPEQKGHPQREETRQLLAEDFVSRQGIELVALMRHPDMRVRQKAQFELAVRDDSRSLMAAIENRDHQLGRIHGIWGLAQIGRRNPEAAAPLMNLLDDDDAEIRAQAARWLGDVRYKAAAPLLVPLLEDSHPRVRFFAAEALGRTGYREGFEPLVRMLEENNDEDVYLRQAGAIALARIGDDDAVAGLSDHSSRAVRVAAVVALKRLESPEVARFLSDEDEYIVTNAARAINDDAMIRDALPALAAILDDPEFVNEPLLRRSINACVYNGTSADAERLAEFALRSDMPEALRIEALEALSFWPEPSEFDRVTGRHRGPVTNDKSDALLALDQVANDLLTGQNAAVTLASVHAVMRLQYKPATAAMLGLLETGADSELAIAVLDALHALGYDQMEDVVAIAMDDRRIQVRMHALQLIAELNLADDSTVELLNQSLQQGQTEEQQHALSVLAVLDSPAAHRVLAGKMDRLEGGNLTAEIQLDVMEAIERSGNESLTNRLNAYNRARSQKDLLEQYRESLKGGNAERGRRIFYTDTGAQCIRCHAVNDEGGDAGPELTRIGSQLAREQLLQSLIDPSARITPGYGNISLHLQDGEIIHGVLQVETETHITILTGGQEKRIARNDIAERSHAVSAMPSMRNILNRSELRDVVEYLTTLDHP